MIFFQRSEKTIFLWLHEKDLKLTAANALDIIQEETGLKRSELLEKENVKA